MRYKQGGRVKKVILSLILAVGLFAPANASVGGFIVNGVVATWGFVEMGKTENKDVKWYVGVTASIFTLRALYELVND